MKIIHNSFVSNQIYHDKEFYRLIMHGVYDLLSKLSKMMVNTNRLCQHSKTLHSYRQRKDLTI